MKRWFGPGFLAVLVLALALRLPELGLRPLHNDEAVNAIKFRALWTANNYKYDPNEFHGPTLPYFTLPFAAVHSSHRFNDFTEGDFRLAAVFFGAGLIVLLLLLTSDLGRAEIFWAALFMALSPAMVFYSRYYIHEMLLVFFTALTGTALWRYGKSGRPAWRVLAGIGLGLMWASKETFVFAVMAMALAAACSGGLARWDKTRWNVKTAAIVAGIAVVVAMLFFSSFFANSAGVVDAIKTYGPWMHRGEGLSPHVHPWNFYFERLLFYHAKGGPVWSEALIVVLALAGFVVALKSRGLIRLIAWYTAWLTLFYTVLPYKTPWCLLGFFYGMILLAGAGAAALLRACKPRAMRFALAALLAAAAAQLGWQAWRGNFAVDSGGVPYCDSAKNPYTYSQTAPDIFRLMQNVDGLERVSPAGFGTVIEVMSPDSYWPLPWYLRRYTQTGYWEKIPAQPLAPIMIVSTALHAGFDERPEKTHLMAGYFELRPGVFFELYVSLDLWSEYIKTLPKEKDSAD